MGSIAARDLGERRIKGLQDFGPPHFWLIVILRSLHVSNSQIRATVTFSKIVSQHLFNKEVTSPHLLRALQVAQYD